jgi:NADH-quinone oxidoreductase subunit J
MNFELIIFYFYAVVAIISALAVILLKNPVHCALNLILCFFSVAAIWILLQAEFLGLVLILVYVGAVMVLFLFVLMMLNINFTKIKEGFVRFLPISIMAAGIMFVQIVLLFLNSKFKVATNNIDHSISNSKQLGTVLYNDYLLQFEIAGIILLVAIIATIGLTLNKQKNNKYQNPVAQVKTKKEKRLTMIKMKTQQQDIDND